MTLLFNYDFNFAVFIRVFVMRGVYNIFSHRKGIPIIQIFRDTFPGMAYLNLDLSSCSRSSAIGVNVWYFLQITYILDSRNT